MSLQRYFTVFLPVGKNNIILIHIGILVVPVQGIAVVGRGLYAGGVSFCFQPFVQAIAVVRFYDGLEKLLVADQGDLFKQVEVIAVGEYEAMDGIVGKSYDMLSIPGGQQPVVDLIIIVDIGTWFGDRPAVGPDQSIEPVTGQPGAFGTLLFKKIRYPHVGELIRIGGGLSLTYCRGGK